MAVTNFLKGMSGHQRKAAAVSDWLTPPEIVKALGPFDLDPCAPCLMAHDGKPWRTATLHHCPCDNGLEKPWKGFVWLNPPYGTRIGAWAAKMARHQDGILLAFARLEVGWFQDSVFRRAVALFFPAGRLRFYRPDGTPGDYTGGAPSVFAAYGPTAAERLRKLQMRGHLVTLNGKENGKLRGEV